MEGQVNKKDRLYFARIIPSVGIYDVCDVIVRTATNQLSVACDKKDKHAYLFSNKELDKTVFKSRLEALEKVTEAEKNKRIINEDTYYEEF
ncbi:hypothetical protein HMPREF0490_00829 [Lachnospiraceae bacterium 6_1_37FAA]|nr:hypothetical protein HMPREF0490_00829 [Lachnospiraceae bacterium 6_1_37FAA]